MNELDKIASSFGVSDPVFKIKLGSHGDLEFEVKNEYSPPIVTNDPVYAIVRKQWNESLDKGRKCFTKYVDTKTAYRAILDTVKEVYNAKSPLKNPSQSVMYQWLCKQEYNGPTMPGFIGLYRYIINNQIGDIRDKNDPRVKNVLAVLELMKEKHEA